MRIPGTNKDVAYLIKTKLRIATLRRVKRVITLPTILPPQSRHSSHWLVILLWRVGVEKNGTCIQHSIVSKGYSRGRFLSLLILNANESTIVWMAEGCGRQGRGSGLLENQRTCNTVKSVSQHNHNKVPTSKFLP